MKTILVVDDIQANLDTAKSYFSTINDYNFVYASNRRDAEKFLGDAYAVITDGSFPTNSEVKFIDVDYNHSIDGKNCYIDKSTGETAWEENIVVANGYWVLFKAVLSGKPAIMLREHGGIYMLLVNENNHNHLGSILNRITTEPTGDDYVSFWRYAHFEGTKYTRDNILRGRTKTQTSSWELAWKRLQEQF